MGLELVLNEHHKKIINEAHSWVDTNGHRRYYEIMGELIKNENGFLYRYNEINEDWELQEPTTSIKV